MIKKFNWAKSIPLTVANSSGDRVLSWERSSSSDPVATMLAFCLWSELVLKLLVRSVGDSLLVGGEGCATDEGSVVDSLLPPVGTSAWLLVLPWTFLLIPSGTNLTLKRRQSYKQIVLCKQIRYIKWKGLKKHFAQWTHELLWIIHTCTHAYKLSFQSLLI